jgi:hypothetical protein
VIVNVNVTLIVNGFPSPHESDHVHEHDQVHDHGRRS